MTFILIKGTNTYILYHVLVVMQITNFSAENANMKEEYKKQENENPMWSVNVFVEVIWPKMNASKRVGKPVKVQQNAARTMRRKSRRRKKEKI